MDKFAKVVDSEKFGQILMYIGASEHDEPEGWSIYMVFRIHKEELEVAMVRVPVSFDCKTTPLDFFESFTLEAAEISIETARNHVIENMKQGHTEH
ncbi:hypothetical protein [Spongorhabdus nitratireducens]